MKGRIVVSLLLILGITIVVSAQSVEVLETYQTDDRLFTQGFEKIEEGKVVYGTGLYGESQVGIYDLHEQDFESIAVLPEEEFGEGLTVTENALWHFTWQEGVAYKRPLEDLSTSEVFTYEGEGWGMAYDLDQQAIWTSDGSDILTKRDPETFEVIDHLKVTKDDEEVKYINELEYANQSLYANVWQSNDIVRIDIDTGQVVNHWDLTPLVDTLSFEEENINRVLNGIAHVEEDIFYVTGKLYPVIWKVKLK